MTYCSAHSVTNFRHHQTDNAPDQTKPNEQKILFENKLFNFISILKISVYRLLFCLVAISLDY